eukprot:SAG25_NODE_973_length_4477_cov_68.014847_2_plen_175_part_00
MSLPPHPSVCIPRLNTISTQSHPSVRESRTLQCVQILSSIHEYVMSEPDISSSAIDTPVTVIPGTGASAASEYRSSGSLCDTTVLLCHRAVTVHGGGILRNGMRILQSFGMGEGNNFLTGDYTTKLSDHEAANLRARIADAHRSHTLQSDRARENSEFSLGQGQCKNNVRPPPS